MARPAAGSRHEHGRTRRLATAFLALAVAACGDTTAPLTAPEPSSASEVGPAAPPPATPAIATLDVRPRAAALLTGAQLQLTVAASDIDGAPVALDGALAVTSSDSTIASVSPDGRVLARRPGVAIISLRAGAVLATASVTVQSPRASELSLDLRLAGVPASVAPALEAALSTAAARWERIITGDLPAVTVSLGAGACGFGTPAISEQVDDVLVVIRVEVLDGPGGVVASGGPCVSRQGTLLPVIGVVRVDADDLSRLQSLGMLEATLAHELGHVLGIGTMWHEGEGRALVQEAHGYVGAEGREAAAHAGIIAPPATAVPVELLGSAGTTARHWSAQAMPGELMTGWIGDRGAITAVTVGALRDLGYDVLEGAAETLPAPAASAPRTVSAVNAVNAVNAADAVGPMHARDVAHRARWVTDAAGRISPRR